MSSDPEWCAPEHWKIEVVSAVRGLLLSRRLSEPMATRAVVRLNRLGVESETLDPLVPAIWRLRHTATAYDAAYVALADLRGITLLTADARLARAAIDHCRVELVGARDR